MAGVKIQDLSEESTLSDNHYFITQASDDNAETKKIRFYTLRKILKAVGQFTNSNKNSEIFNNYINNEATGNYGHAEGNNTKATGNNAHSEGGGTVASGINSHAGGYGTIAAGAAQTAIGSYNIEDETSLFIIGCGTRTERKNALLVDADGNLKVLGSISAEGGFEGVEGGGSISMWTKETTYRVDDVVINDTTIYKCITEHTSGTEFDSENWIALTGEQGATGEQGRDGVTPHIDESTKHWFIGEEDTGITAEGITTVTTTAVVYTGTLSADSWVGNAAPYTQTVTMTGIDETSRPYLYPILSDDVDVGLAEQKAWGCITKAVTSANTITFSCYETKPTVNITFEAEVR